MGYGDGFAAIIGKKWGTRKIRGGKTLLGTFVMGVITLLVLIGFSLGYHIVGVWSASWWVAVVVVSLIAALLEAYTPYGLDNITVPLGTTFFASLLLGGA